MHRWKKLDEKDLKEVIGGATGGGSGGGNGGGGTGGGHPPPNPYVSLINPYLAQLGLPSAQIASIDAFVVKVTTFLGLV